VAKHSYRFGDRTIGIRSTSDGFSAELDDLLSSYRVEEEGSPFISIVIGENGANAGRRSKQFHILYQGTQAIIRTLDLGTLVKTLASVLEGFFLAERGDALYGQFGLISSSSGAALVPSPLITFLAKSRGTLERTGLKLPAEMFTAIDMRSGEVVPIKPTLDVSVEDWDRLSTPQDGNVPPDRISVSVPLTVDVVCLLLPTDQVIEPISQGNAVARLAANVLNLRTLGIRGLETLALVTDQARCYGIHAGKPGEIVRGLASVMEAVSA
jgi:hypothetical protein